MMTIYALKEQMAALDAELAAVQESVAKMAADPASDIAEARKAKARGDELQERRAMLQQQMDRLTEESRAKMGTKALSAAGSDKERHQAARGMVYKAMLRGTAVPQMAYDVLGAIPANDADLGNGSNLMPKNMSNELILDPAIENPVRPLAKVTNITGYSEPRMTVEIDAADLADVTDKQTANELEASTDMVEYGRHKVKIKVEISETVLNGSDTGVAQAVEDALRQGIALNEMIRLGAAEPTGDYVHMSAYALGTGTGTPPLIKHVTGADKRKAVAAALADLPQQYRQNANIVMNTADWFGMIDDMVNQSGTFFPNMPQTFLGRPVVLCDYFDLPVVGNWQYVGINYDQGTITDVQKDVDKGAYKFVLTFWYDIQWRLRSAFRIAEVATGTGD